MAPTATRLLPISVVRRSTDDKQDQKLFEFTAEGRVPSSGRLAPEVSRLPAEIVPVDLYALVMLRDLKADRPIELGDTLVIPFKRRNILIEGAVFAPGSYPYSPTFGIEEYLALAGGRNRFAEPLSQVRVVTP